MIILQTDNNRRNRIVIFSHQSTNKKKTIIFNYKKKKTIQGVAELQLENTNVRHIHLIIQYLIIIASDLKVNFN